MALCVCLFQVNAAIGWWSGLGVIYYLKEEGEREGGREGGRENFKGKIHSNVNEETPQRLLNHICSCCGLSLVGLPW